MDSLITASARALATVNGRHVGALEPHEAGALLRFVALELLLPAVALVAALLLAGCTDDKHDCSNDACKTTEKELGLDSRTVRDARTKAFDSDGTTYTLVRVEYGDTPECDPADDSSCWYSTYCGWVANNQDYPLSFYWVTDADALFTPTDIQCDEASVEDCTLPGEDLPVLVHQDCFLTGGELPCHRIGKPVQATFRIRPLVTQVDA